MDLLHESEWAVRGGGGEFLLNRNQQQYLQYNFDDSIHADLILTCENREVILDIQQY